MKKKILSILLTCSMLVSMAACTSGENPAAGNGADSGTGKTESTANSIGDEGGEVSEAAGELVMTADLIRRIMYIPNTLRKVCWRIIMSK